MQNKLPKICLWILKLIGNNGFDFLSGDLFETYNYKIIKLGRTRAYIWLWFEIIFSIPGLIKNKIYWGTIMFLNYIKITFRNFLKYKSVSLINILGLTLGLTCFSLIAYFVTFQFSYDQYHKNKENIYRIVTPKYATVGEPWAAAFRDAFPEIKNFARFQKYSEVLVENGEKKIYDSQGFYADSTLFDVFSFSFLEGNKKTALVNPNSIVITKDFSQKFFGNENPIGKTLTFNQQNGKEEFRVTGLMDNVSSNSHFHFSFLVSQSTNKAPWINKWFWYQFYTYLLLEKNINVDDFEKRAEDWINKKFEIPQEKRLDLLLQSLTDIHLHSHILGEIEPNQNISSVYLFAVIGILILFVALINFVNLKTAHAVNRAKEVGVRKSIGAERKQLISQFIIESVIISLTAFIISMICVQVLLPLVNNYFGIQIETNAFKNYNIISALFVISLFTGLLSGIYPAFVLSRFNPSLVLKGTSKLTGKSGLRRAMVIFQFGASAFLIISSIAIYNQMNFINKKELGFNKDQIITFNIRSENLRKNYKAFENALLSNSNIAKVSITATLPGGGDWGIDYKAEGINDADIPGARMLVVDYEFIDTYGIEISEGRKFSSEFSADTLTYILNETAVKALNWDNPLNKKISIPILKRDWGNVIGVVKDFHFRSLHEVIEPLIIYIAPTDWAAYVSVKLKSGIFNSEISFIEKTWKTFDPEHPFTFTFFDEDFGKLYLADQRDMELITYATVIAIFIACLGLYALISFTLTQKTKEIGIRKVLGAKITDIVFLVSKEFLVLLIIANLIAWPAAFYFLEDWFENFAYRTEISLTIFIIGSFAGLIIAFSVISYKVVKAASKNPVNSLRTE